MTFVQMLATRSAFGSRSRMIRLSPVLEEMLPDPNSLPVRDCPLKPRPLPEVLARVDALRTDTNEAVCKRAGRFDLYKHWLRPLRAYKGA